MEVLVISKDSDIGNELVKLHLARGDVVHTTTRREVTGDRCVILDILDKNTWSALPQVDVIYFLIGTTDTGVDKTDVFMTNAMMPVDYLGRYAARMKPGTKVVVFSSQFGSIARAINGRAYVYRMSKAALNMGVRCLAHAHKHVNWCVYHPGIVKTKMLGDAWKTFNFEVLEADQAAQKCIDVTSKWSNGFTFLSYNGDTIEW